MPGVRGIPLTQGFYATVDEPDFEWLMKSNWSIAKRGKVNYAQRHKPGSGDSIEYMHRVILDAKPGEFVDHVNHNGLDNRRANIRFCTKRQNLQNRPKPNWPNSFSSKYKGLCKIQGTGRYGAQIKVNERSIFLGAFDTEEEAAAAYDEAATKYFEEFACLNFTKHRGTGVGND